MTCPTRQNISTARADFDVGGFKNQLIGGFDVSYQVNDRLKATLNVFNLADSHANSSAYFYQTRIAPGGAAPDCDTAQASTCYQIHAEEPRSARFTLSYGF